MNLRILFYTFHLYIHMTSCFCVPFVKFHNLEFNCIMYFQMQWSTVWKYNVHCKLQQLQHVTQINTDNLKLCITFYFSSDLIFNATHHKFWTSQTLKKFCNIFHPCYIKYTQQFYHIFYNSLNGKVFHYTTNSMVKGFPDCPHDSKKIKKCNAVMFKLY